MPSSHCAVLAAGAWPVEQREGTTVQGKSTTVREVGVWHVSELRAHRDKDLLARAAADGEAVGMAKNVFLSGTSLADIGAAGARLRRCRCSPDPAWNGQLRLGLALYVIPHTHNGLSSTGLVYYVVLLTYESACFGAPHAP
jgi:hypothetical protein